MYAVIDAYIKSILNMPLLRRVSQVVPGDSQKKRQELRAFGFLLVL